ncbi:metallophosphoesterase [Rhizobium sp. BK602]|uniref:metallophosphoesterase n=1 Tax=Rhizobium sp. BK602 TaxID=2586986 RepID=UPI00162250CA|nr:metallophosphoesterase [Rhizobium sp. BK602]MBB3610659.1 putative phosphodiesterase [Rhizobium sp. BK602]
MRVFAVSDIHLDYEENRHWLLNLSDVDYRSDILILAGDISNETRLIEWCFISLQRKFLKVCFVPGNHDLWVSRNQGMTSFDKFRSLGQLAKEHQICTEAYHDGPLSIVPLLGWYDYSFGLPNEQLLRSWVDFRACLWPDKMSVADITAHFLRLNQPVLSVQNDVVISFSHFVPRIDLMPEQIPMRYRYVYPVLGSAALDRQIRQLQADRHLHVYGHSHVNRDVVIDSIEYTNNAFGYPSEQRISRKQLLCIYER